MEAGISAWDGAVYLYGSSYSCQHHKFTIQAGQHKYRLFVLHWVYIVRNSYMLSSHILLQQNLQQEFTNISIPTHTKTVTCSPAIFCLSLCFCKNALRAPLRKLHLLWFHVKVERTNLVLPFMQLGWFSFCWWGRLITRTKGQPSELGLILLWSILHQLRLIYL